MKNNHVYFSTETGRCMLCHDAPCSMACKKIDVSSVIRSIRFGNLEGAAARILNEDVCVQCERQSCLKVCNRAKLDTPLDIPFIMTHLAKHYKKELPKELPSLAIDFCGVHCDNPFVLASSVITCSYDMCRRAFEAGWGGISIKTICSLDIHEVSPRFDIPQKGEFPFSGFKNMEQLSPNTPEFDFAWMKQLKEEFPTRLIIASIMGRNEEEWEQLSRMAQEAKADIIECNFSCPQMVGKDLGSDIGQNPAMVERYTRACTRGASIPVIAKLTPNIAKADAFVEAAYKGGAVGIAGINTIKSIMTVDFSGEGIKSSVQGKTAVSGYSGKGVKPIALRFVKEIYDASVRLQGKDSPVHISGIGGIETWKDAVDFLLLGSSNLQVCTAVMQYGHRIIDDLKEGLQIYMYQHGISDLNMLVGKALPDVLSPDDLVRDKIIYPRFNLQKCIACGRCYVSCMDGGHQAIKLVGRKPVLDPEKCVGCHLCSFVCVTGAIEV